MLSTHALPPTPYPITHKCTQTQAHTLGGLHCMLENKSKSCQVLWHNVMLIHTYVCQNAKNSSEGLSFNQTTTTDRLLMDSFEKFTIKNELSY